MTLRTRLPVRLASGVATPEPQRADPPLPQHDSTLRTQHANLSTRITSYRNVNEPLARPSVSMVRMYAWEHNGTKQPVIPTNIRLTARFDSELDTRSGFDQQATEDSD